MLPPELILLLKMHNMATGRPCGAAVSAAFFGAGKMPALPENVTVFRNPPII